MTKLRLSTMSNTTRLFLTLCSALTVFSSLLMTDVAAETSVLPAVAPVEVAIAVVVVLIIVVDMICYKNKKKLNV